MIARWWNSHCDEWQLIALKPNGCWVPLAIVKSGDRTAWSASMCITPGGKGSTWMGSEIMTTHNRRAEAFASAERMCGFQKRVKHVSCTLIHRRGWDYLPFCKYKKQMTKAAVYAKSLHNFLCLITDMRLSLSLASKSMPDNKTIFKLIILDIARGEIWKSQQRLSDLMDQNTQFSSIIREVKNRMEEFNKAKQTMHLL